MRLPIIKTKLVPPKTTARVVIRTRLFNRLSDAANRRLTVISAGGGWGKSVLLTSFLESCKTPYVWYSLDHNDKDPVLFLSHIAEGIRRRFGRAGEKTLKAIESAGDAVSWQFIASTLFNEILDRLTGRFLLVLDDYHSLSGSHLMTEVFTYFLKLCPPGVCFVVSSREKPSLQLEKLRACGELMELDADDLRFNKQEIRSLFQTAYNIDLTPRDIEVIEGYTEGWVLSLRLTGEALSGSPSEGIPAFLSRLKRPGASVFNYFDEEVFKGLPHDIHRFLKETSILNYFNASVYDFISGKDGSGSLIETVIKKDLFVIRQADNWYRYHHLFRDFLDARLKEDEDPAYIRGLHLKAALFFGKTNDLDEVIYHSIHAGDYGRAAAIIEKRIGYVFASTLAQSLVFWLEQIPEEDVLSHAGLLLGKGWANYVNGKWYIAIDYLNRAMDTAIKINDKVLLGKAVYFVLIIYISQGSFEKAKKTVEDALVHLDPGSLETFNTLVFYAIALMCLNKPVDAFRVWGDILPPLSQIDMTIYINAVSGMGYEYHLPMGMLGEAKRNIEESVSHFRVSDPIAVYGVSLLFLAEVKHDMGFFQEASLLLEEAIREKEKRGLVFTLPVAFNMQAINAIFLGGYAKARQAVRNAEDIVSKTDAPNFWRGHHLNVAKALLAVHDSDRDAFNRYAENAVSESLRIGECYAFYRVACWLAPYYARFGYRDKALSLLQDSITKTSMIGNVYGEARSRLLLASISYDQGNLAVAKSYLGDSLSLCLTGDCDFLFLYKERIDAARLLPLALSERLSIPLVSRLSQGFKGECAGSVTGLLRHKDPEVRKVAVGVLSGMEYREAEREIVCLLDDPSPAVRACAGEAVRRLRTLPPVPLRIYTLGEFRLSVGDRDIPASAWKRRTAKSILKYLVFSRGREIGREMLIDTFFRDMSKAAGDENFRQAISSLRRILEPGIPPKRDSSYLKFRNGQYHLKLPEGSFVDAFAFEDICNNAFNAKREGSLEHAISCCKSAIELYSNDLLMEDVYDEWTAPLRAKYSDMYVRVLKETSRYHFNQFEYDICIEMLNKILERDKWDEDAYLLLMKSYLAMGNRSLAIKAYKRCDTILRKELGVGTCNALSDLFRSLLKFR